MCSSTATTSTPSTSLGNVISVTSINPNNIIINFTGPNIDTGGSKVALTTTATTGIVVGQDYFVSVTYSAQILTIIFSSLLSTIPPAPPAPHITYTSQPFNNLLVNKDTTMTPLYGYSTIVTSTPFDIRLGNSYVSMITTLNLLNGSLMISTANPTISVTASYNSVVTTEAIHPTGSVVIPINSTTTIESTITPAASQFTIGIAGKSLLTATFTSINLSKILLDNGTCKIGYVTTDGDYYANFIFIGTAVGNGGGSGKVPTGPCPVIYSTTNIFPSSTMNPNTNCKNQFDQLRSSDPNINKNVSVDIGCYEYLCLGRNPETNTDINTLQWAQIWNQGTYNLNANKQLQVNCPVTFQTIMYTNANGNQGTTVSQTDNGDGTVVIRPVSGGAVSTRTYSLQGHSNANLDMDYVFSHYFNTTITSTTNPGVINMALYQEPNYQQQQTSIVQACIAVPGLCDVPATTMCKNCSRNQLATNPDLLTLCGCQASTTDPLDPNIYGSVKPACDPLCAMSKVSHTIDLKTGVENECTDAVCVMDNITISASRSQVSGVSFTQVCPACEAQKGSQIGCKCIVDVSIPGIATTIGISGSDTFRQYCPNALCLLLNSTTQVLEPVPCDTYVQTANTTVIPTMYPIPTWVWYLAGIIILLGILVLMSAAYAGKNVDIVIPARKLPVQYHVRPGTSSKRF